MIFSSDHGEMMGSHGKWEKMAPYEEALRVPLVFRWKEKIGAGKRSDALFTPMDYHPTLARIAGASVPTGLDGRDLGGELVGEANETGRKRRERVLIANYSSHWDYFHSEWPWPEWRGVRTRQHTYIKWLSGKEELFDNLKDPYQMSDLSGSDSETMKAMRESLRQLLAEAHDTFMAGPAYASWFDDERNIVRTGRGPVQRV